MSRLVFGLGTTALLILTLLLFPPIPTGGDLGLCLPSPNQWTLLHLPSWIINTLLIFLSAVGISLANKRFNFIPETAPNIALALLIIVTCNCITTSTLTTSTLLLAANVLSIYIIFSTYEARNATREFFIVGTLPAIGAMFQYAFLFMIPVYIAAGILMKSMRLREFIAFLFGLVSPYWIAVGLGLVSPFAFQLPDTLTVISREAVKSDVFYTLLASGIMAFIGIILALYNGVKLFTRNSQLRSMHTALNVMGIVALIASIVDFNNFVAYFGTLALWAATEFAATLSLYESRRPSLALLVLSLIFIPLYILAI